VITSALTVFKLPVLTASNIVCACVETQIIKRTPTDRNDVNYPAPRAQGFNAVL